MSNTLKQQSSEQEMEPQSPSQIFKIDSVTAKDTQDQTLEGQQNNIDFVPGEEAGQIIEQSKSPKALLTAKKQNSVQGQGEFNSGRWSQEEHNLFLEALRIHGKNWDKIQKHVKTRCVQNIRSHSQKFNQKLEKLVDAQGNLLEGVDQEKQEQAGVDKHGSASYYFKLLMKRTKKDAMKNAMNKSTPTNNSTRPRVDSYESINSQGLSGQLGNASSADSQEEQDINKSQKSQEQVTSHDREDMMDMEFDQNNGNGNIQGAEQQNQSDHALPNSNLGNRNLYDTRQILNEEQQQQQMGPTNSHIIQFPNGIDNRDSFRDHNRNKLNEVLSIDNRTKMHDSEIANYQDDLFNMLVDRETTKQSAYHPKKESFKTNRDYVQANLMYNGLQRIDERLKGSRFNFQQTNDFKQQFLMNQQIEQNDFLNQMNMDINSADVQVNGYPQQAQLGNQNGMQHDMQNNGMNSYQQEHATHAMANPEYTHVNQFNPLQSNSFVDSYMGEQDVQPAENNTQMDVAEDVVMQTMIIQ